MQPEREVDYLQECYCRSSALLELNGTHQLLLYVDDNTLGSTT
jgi:hypothetical protein